MTRETFIGVILCYLLISLFCKWVLSWGGGAVLERIQGNWLGSFLFYLLHFFTVSEEEEGIRLAALTLWIVCSVAFVIYIGWYLMKG